MSTRNVKTLYGINASGQVVGYSGAGGGNNHAFLYTPGTGMKDLGTLPGDVISYATGINASGQVVGYSGTGTLWHAFLYSGGVMTNLGLLPGGTQSMADGINNSGQISGTANTAPEYQNDQAFIYSRGVMTPLGTLPGGGRSFGQDINASGQVTGGNEGANYHAFLYTPGSGMTDLGVLPYQSRSVGIGINDSGQVVGVSFIPDTGAGHAFLYTPGFGMTDLGTLPGQAWSQGGDINAGGQVVGYTSGAYGLRAFLYSGGAMTDLNGLIDPSAGWALSLACAINDSDWITGSGDVGGQTHAYLVTPVPEPISLVSGTIGLACIGAYVKRRARRL